MFKPRIIAVALAATFFIFYIWLHSERQFRKFVRPPLGATNLISFLQSQPDVVQIRIFTNGGDAYLEVLRPVSSSLLSLPSGPPAYIFDKSGNFIDWAADLGEASKFNARWSYFTNATPITIEEAKKLFNSKMNPARQP